jgi:hypothetical protein
MKFIGYVATFFIVAFFNAIISGWTFSILWGWFIAGTFGLPSLSIPLAIGFSLTVGFLTPLHDDGKENKGFVGIMLESSLKVICKSLISLSSGWIVLQFV